MYNCTIWFQTNGEWYGDVCEESIVPDVRIQDVVGGAQEFGSVYENTLFNFVDMLCEEGSEDCDDGKKAFRGIVSGKVPKASDVEGSDQV